jgi:hypothetical protein
MTGRRPEVHPWLWPTISAGVLLQLSLYLAAPSLLLDESRVALNIVSRSWSGFFRPLDYDQTAPLLFLWAGKGLVLLGGANEYALRVLPLAAGVASLPLIYLLGQRLADARAGALATALAAFSPALLQLSYQVKPYTLDAAVALLLLWWALDWADRPRERGPAARVLVAGFFAIWASTPSIFTLAGVLVAFAFAPRSERPRSLIQVLVAIAWLLSFVTAYLWIYAPAANNPYMRQFWQGSLVTISEPGWVGRLWHGIREVVWQTIAGESTAPPMTAANSLLVNGMTAAVLMLAVSGLRCMGLRVGWVRVTLFAAPAAIAVLASFMGRYPLAGRVMLFAVPWLVISVAAGVVALIDAVPVRWKRPVGVTACAWLFAASLPPDLALEVPPRALENVRWAAREYESRRQPSEPIYVFAASLPAWTFYTTDWAMPDTVRLGRLARLASSGGPAFENAPPRDRPLRPGDGDSLVYEFSEGREVIGLYTGAQWRSGTGRAQYAPDTNWTSNEARRIREAASPGIWVLMSRSLGLERYLFAATDMCTDLWLSDGGANLAHLVPRPPGLAPCAPLPIRSGPTTWSE